MPKLPSTEKKIEFVGDGCLVYRAPSSTRFGLFHYVMYTGIEIKCTCEGFAYAGHCWHADKLQEQMHLLEEAEREGIAFD